MTDKERRAKKAAYDREYRKKNRAMLKRKHAEYFQRTYNPVKAAVERKKRMWKHVEYCRRPEYRSKKRKYDRERRSSRFGEFAQAHAVLVALQKEIRKQMPDRFERYAQSSRHQWNPINQQRRRNGRHATDSI